MSAQYDILTLSLVGTSDLPFSADPGNFGFQYADGPAPYHSENTNTYGFDGANDSNLFTPQFPFAQVAKGQFVHGTVAMRASPDARVLFFMTAGTHTTRLAQWLVSTGHPGSDSPKPSR